MSGKMVTILAPQNVNQAGDVLGRAFYDDPLMTYITPDRLRKFHLSRCFKVAVHYGILYGATYTTSDISGVAIWVPSRTFSISPVQMIKSGVLRIPLLVGIGPLVRALRSLSYQESLHHRDAPMEHWYLAFLGVDPFYQRRGIGSTLMQPVLKRADSENKFCYLETTKAANVSFYRIHGFDVVSEVNIPNGGPKCWTMLRHPRSIGYRTVHGTNHNRFKSPDGIVQ